jgi:hypothetical protein
MVEIEAVPGVLDADLDRSIAEDHIDGNGLVTKVVPIVRRITVPGGASLTRSGTASLDILCAAGASPVASSSRLVALSSR